MGKETKEVGTTLKPVPNKAKQSKVSPSEVDLVLKEAGEADQSDVPIENLEYIFSDAELSALIEKANVAVIVALRKDLFKDNEAAFSEMVQSKMKTAQQHEELKEMKAGDREARRRLREEELVGDETPPEAALRWVKNKTLKNRASRWVVPIGIFVGGIALTVLTGRGGLRMWNARRYGVSNS